MMRQGHWSSATRIALLWLCTLQLSLALFEDQSGTFDWYKQQVGPITSAAFHKNKPRLYVGTQQGVVGSLHLRDGGIEWRRHLGMDEQLDATAIVDRPGLLLSLSQQATVLRAWDQNEGALRWESRLSPQSQQLLGSTKPVLHVAVVDEDEEAKIIVVANGALHVGHG